MLVQNLHYLVNCMIRGVNFSSEKRVVIKNNGVNLFHQIFSNNVTDEDIARFNEKFASQGCAAYPMLQRRNSEISVAPEIRPRPIAQTSEEERIAAKSPKPIEVYTGSQQLSLFWKKEKTLTGYPENAFSFFIVKIKDDIWKNLLQCHKNSALFLLEQKPKKRRKEKPKQ